MYKSSLRRRISIFCEQGALQIMALMCVAWMVIFCYLPLTGLWIAFSDYNLARPIFSAPWVGFRYFKEFFNDRYILNSIVNTLAISGLNLTIGFSAPIIFALLLNELKNANFKKLVQTVSYLPHFISWVVLGGFLISWFSEAGLVNEVLMKLCIIKRPIYLLAESRYFWGLAVGSSIWKSMGWGTIIYLASIARIDPELYEASAMDGANRFQQCLNITLPGIRYTIAILFVLNSAYLFNSNFDQIFVLRNSLNTERSTVLDIYTYRIGIQQLRFSYSSAVGLIKSIISLLLIMITNKVSGRLTDTSLF